MNDVFFKECNVTKVNQYEALKVWDYLKIGKKLYLFREKEDDKECVSLYYKATDEEYKKIESKIESKNIKIGILSGEDATPINKFLMARQAGKVEEEINKEDKLLFECLISKFDEEADEDKRISVAIFIKKSS